MINVIISKSNIQMWVVFLAGGSAGGYTSPPKTHIGRLAVAIMIMGMPIIIATMTGMATRSLMMTPEEQSMMMRIDRNRLRARAMEAAVRLLQYWYRNPEAYSPESTMFLGWGKKALKNSERPYRRNADGKLVKSAKIAQSVSPLQRQASTAETTFMRNHLFAQLCRANHELFLYDDSSPQALASRPTLQALITPDQMFLDGSEPPQNARNITRHPNVPDGRRRSQLHLPPKVPCSGKASTQQVGTSSSYDMYPPPHVQGTKGTLHWQGVHTASRDLLLILHVSSSSDDMYPPPHMQGTKGTLQWQGVHTASMDSTTARAPHMTCILLLI
jgi:hypothetical protein